MDMQKVYVEFVLLDNFLMDFLLLYLALRFSEKKARLGRVCGGAALGAVYAAAAVALPFLQSFPCKLLASLLMLLCARTYRPWKNFLRTAALFYAATFLFGGACFAAMYFFSRETYSGAFINLPVLRYLLLGGTAAVLLIEYLSRRHYPRQQTAYHLSATLAGETIHLDAFLDTGNHLRDLSGRSVIIASQDAVFSQITPALKSKLCLEEWESSRAAGLRLMLFPLETVSGKGMLVSFFPDSLLLTAEGKTYAAKAYIALCDQPLNENYTALLGPRLLLIPS